ncbi:Phosphate carrier protein, mitochondrial [Amphibalanus amphitrite]|uniref:Phosphate carrier protein, mitochondrial n=1 Tax=Amphibalanus amphitrite TaxID=1232801 RepID=A0A6A4UW86_AMPAM|nr:Phosphate carrier protein, mitochondrial [Amphibalanus amphitrite]
MIRSLWDTARSSPFPTVAQCEPSAPSQQPQQQLVHGRNIAAFSTAEPEYSCEYGSPKFFAIAGFGGILSCGITHTAIVPLDLVKCRLQTNADKYKGIFNGFKVTVKEEGVRGLARGWAPTLIGYSMQGLCKFGFYELFKHVYSNVLGEEKAYLWRTSLYLAASASAEFFADIALAPMEALKVRIQTMPGFPATLRAGFPIIMQQEGWWGFYKGGGAALGPYVVPKPRAECSKGEQLVVTFAAGYIAGVFCAIVSHPADTVVSKLTWPRARRPLDVAKSLGFMGMWKGLTARIIMIGTLTALQWVIYDGVKVALRVPRPPPPSMPESLRLKLEAKQQ